MFIAAFSNKDPSPVRAACLFFSAKTLVKSLNWHLWHASKITLQMPTLDVRCLSDEALTNAERIFRTLKHQRMLPFNEADHDPVRHELDRLLLTEVLNITIEDAHNAIHRLRELLCAEPSIHGGKKSRCDLEKEWAKLNR